MEGQEINWIILKPERTQDQNTTRVTNILGYSPSYQQARNLFVMSHALHMASNGSALGMERPIPSVMSTSSSLTLFH
ncbi:hypothetical protein Vadar_016503 [Vaccinium darrowii]|uniref:Uncharacterized protein n=1 Tax=Vaccinium darrowii TaxID=229202 RepID=A0ACB7Y052_9ERIC|nr:hypothetical protein Vadar_016503 [Vaccinium darrowii]